MLKEENNIFQINEDELIEFLDKKALVVEKGSILIEGDSIYFQFSNKSHNGENSFLNDSDIAAEFLEMEFVELLKINDFRFEIYFDTSFPIEII